MTHHVAIFSESVDQAVAAPIAAVADPSLTVSGDNVQIPDYASMLVGVYGLGINLSSVQLQSPSLRRFVNVDAPAMDAAAVPPASPAANFFFKNPIQLDVSEQLQAYAAESGAGATRMNVLVFLNDGKLDTIADPIFTVKANAAQTLVAYTWTNGALTFGQVLPVGDYAIVGAAGWSTGLIAFRFVFQGSTPRPGGIGSTLGNYLQWSGQRYGGWGVWGIFNSTTPPTVDFFSGSADTGETIFLDLIKVG